MARCISILISFALALVVLAPATGASTKPSNPLARCAYGTAVPGLPGFLPAAVLHATDRYAAGLPAASVRTRAVARRVFAAAAAAYVYGLPQVTERATIRHFGHNQLVSVAALATPAVKTVVAPNNDTAYTVAWLDLTTGPMVIDVPNADGRFYTFQFLDAFTNAFSYLGTGSTGTRAGSYALVPPGWSGKLPTRIGRINALTNTVWLLGRTLVQNAADLPATKRVLQQYAATPLAMWAAGTRNRSVVLDRYPPTIPRTIPTGAEFIAVLNQELNIDPPAAADDCALRAMAPAGIRLPHPTHAQQLLDDASNLPPALPPVASDPAANAAISAGTAAGAQIISAGVNALNLNSRQASNGWEILGSWVGRYDRDYIGRAIVTLDLLGANTPQQTIYPIASSDAGGRKLDGSRRYTIRFPKGSLPPVRAFWSLTMYNASFFLYDNQISRYSIGDRTPALHIARDGSLTIYVQHAEPVDPAQRANWLPAPSGVFHLMLRLYQPKSAALNGAWKPAPVERVGSRPRSRLASPAKHQHR